VTLSKELNNKRTGQDQYFHQNDKKKELKKIDRLRFLSRSRHPIFFLYFSNSLVFLKH